MLRWCVAVACVGLFVAPGTAQFGRVLTRPGVPDRAALDRLNLALDWHLWLPVGGRRDGIALVQLFERQLFVQLRNGVLFAIDADTGSVQWRARVGDAYGVLRPVGTNDRLVLVMNGTRVHGLERKTGVEEWVYDLPAVPSVPPTADNYFLYVGKPDGTLTAFLLPTGPQKPAPKSSEAEAPVAPPETASATRQRIEAALTRSSASGSLRTATATNIFDTRSATSVAIQAKSRAAAVLTNIDGRSGVAQLAARPEVFWRYLTQKRAEFAPFLFGDGQLFFPSADRTGVALDVIQQDLLYTWEADAPIVATASLDRTGYLATANDILYAVELPTGRNRWRYLANGPMQRSPVVQRDDVYVVAGSRGLVRIDRATGTQVWQTAEATRFVAANPKFVYAEDALGKILLLDRRDGQVLARLDTTEFTVAYPNALSDRIFIGAHNGLLLALHDRDFPKSLDLRSAPPPAAKPVETDDPKTDALDR